MKNVEWVEVLPFHQLGAFKWKELGYEYRLADRASSRRNCCASTIARFRDTAAPPSNPDPLLFASAK